MNKIFSLAIILLCQSLLVSAQKTDVQNSNANDRYSSYVQQLESGKTNIDYTDFRNSFLDSRQYAQKTTHYNDLKKQVYAAINDKNYNEVIRLTKAMLSIDYTSMFAHMYLQKTYGILGDTLNETKYHDIEFGLIYSITKSGDGLTCETGWHVTQIEEEYFIIKTVLGASFMRQSIAESETNTCDKMDVKTEDGTAKTYYFEANKVFEMEHKLFDK